MTTETILSRDGYDLPGNLAEFISLINESMERIPVEFRESAEIEFELSTYYDSPELTMNITYTRPSTKKEDEIRHKMHLKSLKDNIERYATLTEQARERFEREVGKTQ